MDDSRFDCLVRSLSATRTRRGIITGLARPAAGTALAALVAVPMSEDVAADCRRIGDPCTSGRQCCGHAHKSRICSLNTHAGAGVSSEPTCCAAKGKRCNFTIECCGSDATVACVGAPGEGRCRSI